MEAGENRGDPPVYELGLAISGAGLGGVYTAGVLDFLLEALLELEKTRASSESRAPPWQVKLTDIVGTSSGGIVSSMGVSMLGTDYEPLRFDYDPCIHEAPRHNALYQGFVTWASVDDLLSLEDLSNTKNSVAQSFANANFFQRVANNVFNAQKPAKTLPKFASNLHLTLTHTNLEGIPYASESHSMGRGEHRNFIFRNHADYTTFSVTCQESDIVEHDDNGYILNLSGNRNSDIWKRCIECTIATSAYPATFAPALVENKRIFYENRFDTCPAWESDDPDDDSEMQKFLAVDGFLNIRPYDLTEKLMKGRRSAEADTTSSRGSVVLIDMYSPGARTAPSTTGQSPLFNTMMHTLAAFRWQASFKYEEIQKLQDEDDLSAFLLTPRINEERIVSVKPFSPVGFFDEKLRIHDFMAGRRSAQKFLRETFVLSQEVASKNPIFSGFEKFVDGNGKVPIVPLYGTAAKECIVPKWPSVSGSTGKHVKMLVRKRISGLSTALARNNGLLRNAKWYQVSTHVRNLGVHAGLSFARKYMYRKSGNAIDAYLEPFGSKEHCAHCKCKNK